MLSRLLARSTASAAAAVARPATSGVPAAAARRGVASLDEFGNHVFKGAIAAPYLEKHGLAADTLESSGWASDDDKADKVAAAILDWARDNDASVYQHWFQPMGASGVRHGMAGGVQNTMMEFRPNGRPAWGFSGENLRFGETDGSSFNNGGLRHTHRAGGYLTVDPTSPVFLRGDTIFIPSALTSYDGHALDEKTPLKRAEDAVSREGRRLLGKLGFDVEGLQMNIGVEQELFFVPRDAYRSRPDLMLTGRTVMGRDAPRGQEMCDHYMGVPSMATPALFAMQEIQRQCMLMGIPLRTRHREVAPGQYEFAPLYGDATTQVDQNLVVMKVIEEVSAMYGLAALLQEKPFNNVNGSGKHNNWSLGGVLAEGGEVNLLNPKHLAKASGNDEIFPVIMAAMIKAVAENGDLLRSSCAVPGNDFRLGACEAPPAIISVYLGDDLTDFLTAFAEGKAAGPYVPGKAVLDTRCSQLPTAPRPAEDRNRTSPFPYGGSRFEFRAVGSSQNVAVVNTVLGTIAAKAFKDFADAIEAGQSPREVAAAALGAHMKTHVFNGNSYDEASQDELTKRGCWRIDSGVDAIQRMTADKNVALFEEMGVLDATECAARQDASLHHYAGTVEMEVRCMIDMIHQHVLPACAVAGTGDEAALRAGAKTLADALAEMEAVEELPKKAALARTLRLETMVDVRAHCDQAEAVCPAGAWTLPSYMDLLFLDQTTSPLTD